MAAPYPLGLPMAKSKKHIRLRFQAVVIASQLPDNTAEALLVLDYARDLVVEFFDDPSSAGCRRCRGTTTVDSVRNATKH